MSNSYAPLVSFVPLAVLAVVAWRSLNPVPSGHVTIQSPSAPPALETQPLAQPASAAPAPSGPSAPDVLKDYVEFDLDTIFVKPAGPRGLEYTPGTMALADRKVRISGWMVRHLHDDPGMFLLHTQPMVLNMSEYGLADDLPPSAMHVIGWDRPGWAPIWTPRPLVVCGRLELGPRQERDGRVSHLRLFADHILDRESGTPADLLKPIGLQPGRLKAAALSADPPSVSQSIPLSSNHASTNPTQ